MGDDMTEDKILKAARKLGKEIGKSQIWKDFRTKSEDFKSDGELQQLLVALREMEKAQSEKLEKGIPVEVDEKRELKGIEEKISRNGVFVEFIACENRYLALMTQIDRAIKEGTDKQEEKEKAEKETKKPKKE
jgi:cell fate (sporulation/competence/biofilm development) regulator YlbF (YheA/YmcA/DUF963 family)